MKIKKLFNEKIYINSFFFSFFLVLITIQINNQLNIPINNLNRLIHVILCYLSYKYIQRTSFIRLINFSILILPFWVFFGNSSNQFYSYTFLYVLGLIFLNISVLIDNLKLQENKSVFKKYLIINFLILSGFLSFSNIYNSRLLTVILTALFIYNVFLIYFEFNKKIISFNNSFIGKIKFLIILPIFFFLFFVAINNNPIFQEKALTSSRFLTGFYFLDNYTNYLPFGSRDISIKLLDGTTQFHNIFFDSFRAGGLLSIPLILMIFTSLIKFIKNKIFLSTLFFFSISLSIPLEAGFFDLLSTVITFGVLYKSSKFAQATKERSLTKL